MRMPRARVGRALSGLPQQIPSVGIGVVTTERRRFTRAAQVSGRSDFLWVRILDVSRALESRTYERDGELVLQVIDRLGDRDGPAAGRYRLVASGGTGTCERTDAEPDLTVDVRALSAALLGGTRLIDATRAGGGAEQRAGALVEADLLFRTADEPWCSTWF